MEKHRCPWCGTDPLYQRYHDEEWGVPLLDSKKLFEFLLLESMQAGLSWITILRKRENFRAAFADFDPERIARFTDTDRARLMANSGIIRNRAKIDAAIVAAQKYLDIEQRQGFTAYLWQFVDGTPLQNNPSSMKDLPAKTAIAERMSKHLRNDGFKFVGPTIMYAHMQATGMVNDHITSCHRHAEVAAMAKAATEKLQKICR